MLLKIEVGLMKIMCSCNSVYILRLSYAKDFACTKRWRPKVPAPKRPAPLFVLCSRRVEVGAEKVDERNSTIGAFSLLSNNGCRYVVLIS